MLILCDGCDTWTTTEPPGQGAAEAGRLCADCRRGGEGTVLETVKTMALGLAHP